MLTQPEEINVDKNTNKDTAIIPVEVYMSNTNPPSAVTSPGPMGVKAACKQGSCTLQLASSADPTWIPGPMMKPSVWKRERREMCVVRSEIRVAEEM